MQQCYVGQNMAHYNWCADTCYNNQTRQMVSNCSAWFLFGFVSQLICLYAANDDVHTRLLLLLSALMHQITYLRFLSSVWFNQKARIRFQSYTSNNVWVSVCSSVIVNIFIHTVLHEEASHILAWRWKWVCLFYLCFASFRCITYKFACI